MVSWVGMPPGQPAPSPSADAPRLSFRGLRIAALLALLVLTCLWAVGETRKRGGRQRWKHPLRVDVVLLYRGAAPAGMDVLQRSVPALERWLTDELHRYRPQSHVTRAMSLTVRGPLRVEALPPPPPVEDGLGARVRAYLALRGYLREVDRLALRGAAGELQLYVIVEPPAARVRFAEGWNAGERSVVQAAIDGGTVDMALIAMGHELLHTVGASDKYGAAGHAEAPGGLVEPDLSPRYPQRFAEIMVGERPTGPQEGVEATSLATVRVGLQTAREIRWVR